MSTTADYIIIGAGSAGCVLADRLSASGENSVLVLEAGGHDQRITVRMPSAFYLPMNNPNLSWNYRAEAAPGLAGRELDCPRGRLLGGSSSINGMVYVRGHPLDFDGWAAQGATGWAYADVLPYFKRAERFDGTLEPGLQPYRGSDGPLVTCEGEQRSPLYGAFLQAAEQAGHPLSADLNGYQQEGFGALPMTVAQGVRQSAARAYLRPARRRPNVTVHTHVLADTLIFTGDRATGVRCRSRSGNVSFTARKEVLVSAGAINSPQLLQRSGVGPGELLQQHGVPVVHASPNVGANLMDHLEVYLQYRCRQRVSLLPWTKPPGNLWVGLRWLLARSGLGATNHFEVGGFIRSSPQVPWPDIQFHFLPAAMRYDGQAKADGHGFQVHIGPMLPTSRGHVAIGARDPDVAPLIDFAYMSTDADRAVFRAAIRHARDIIAQPALAAYRDEELAPGAELQDDAALDAFVASMAESAYHPCGTCRMGEDSNAVVDPAGRVHGVTSLRVIDASIFPTITNGNLNAPTIMAAEKIADAIMGKQLAPEPLPFAT